MKFSNFIYSAALLQVHYSISFKVMSQRFINSNILVEQGCASIKKQTFFFFIFIAEIRYFFFSKFLDFVMFGTGDLGHNGEKLKTIAISLNHHICPIFHAENNLSKLQLNFAHFIGPILTLRGPAPLKTTIRHHLTFFY
jgi:hypothetical protein